MSFEQNSKNGNWYEKVRGFDTLRKMGYDPIPTSDEENKKYGIDARCRLTNKTFDMKHSYGSYIVSISSNGLFSVNHPYRGDESIVDMLLTGCYRTSTSITYKDRLDQPIRPEKLQLKDDFLLNYIRSVPDIRKIEAELKKNHFKLEVSGTLELKKIIEPILDGRLRPGVEIYPGSLTSILLADKKEYNNYYARTGQTPYRFR